jgi:ABC-type Fe3+ transport system permease subunit/DNA-binding beta-propeller fold protein YncE
VNWPLLKNSLLVTMCSTVLAVAIGFLAALCATSLQPRFRNLILACGVLSLALPSFLVTNSWLHFLGHTGVWRAWLPFNIVSLSGAVWILTLLTWPITLFFTWSTWRQLDPAHLEADPAISGSALLRGLLVPLARGSLAQAAILTFVLVLNNFAVPAILQVKVLPAEMWVSFNTSFDTLGALRLSWPLVVLPLLLIIFFARRKLNWPQPERPLPAELFRRQLGRFWFYLSTVGTMFLCFVAALPLFQLIFLKRTWIELPGALEASTSAIWNSFVFAALSSALILALSVTAGLTQIGSSRRPRRAFLVPPILRGIRLPLPARNERGEGRGEGFRHHLRSFFTPFHLFNSLLWLPFLVPGVLLGILLITIFNRPILVAFYQSFGIVILAFVVRYLALGWSAVAYAFGSVDRNLTDAARLVGATRWQILRRVHLPQVAPQLLAAWYVVFLLCLWDVESIILVMPPGGETLALRVFNLLHYGHNAQVNALCLTLLVLAIAPLVVWRASRALRSRSFQLLLLPLLLASCSQRPSTDTAIQSRFFSHVQIIGTRGVGVGQLNKPRSVALDSHDELFVVDMTGRVQKFSSNGVFLLSWQMPQTDLGKPKGMCRDRSGNIVIVEPHYQRVNHFSPEGKLLAQWGTRGTNAGEFVLPRAVAINSHNEIFVSEYEAMERVQQFKWNTPTGSPLPILAAPKSDGGAGSGQGSGVRACPVSFLNSIGHAGNGPGEFNRPEGMCVDTQDLIYVADSCNHRIQIFSRDGKLLRSHGKAGSGRGELSYPYDICVDKAGRQYVCEFGNSRIQVFDAHDRSIEIIGGPGGDPGRFSNPWGVALDSAENLYVADSQNHRVQKLIRN